MLDLGGSLAAFLFLPISFTCSGRAQSIRFWDWVCTIPVQCNSLRCNSLESLSPGTDTVLNIKGLAR